MKHNNDQELFNAVGVIVIVALILAAPVAWHFFAPCSFFKLSEAPIRCVR